MLSILGAALGFVGSALPEVFSFFNKKGEDKTKLEILKLQSQLMEKGSEVDLLSFREKASDSEHERLLKHDTSMQGDTGFVGGLRKSVRPAITYLFFFLFAVVKVTSLIKATESNDFYTAIELVWDEETKTIFAAIMGFWFGSRALEKKRVK